MTGIESMFWRHRGEREDWGINHCMLPTSISNRNTRQTMHKYGREAFFLGLSFILHQMKQNKNLKKKVFVFYSTFFQTTTTIWPITVQPRFHFLVHSRELSSSTQLTQYLADGNPAVLPVLQLTSFLVLGLQFLHL